MTKPHWRLMLYFCVALLMCLPLGALAADPIAADSAIAPSDIAKFHAAITAGRLDDVSKMLVQQFDD